MPPVRPTTSTSSLITVVMMAGHHDWSFGGFIVFVDSPVSVPR